MINVSEIKKANKGLMAILIIFIVFTMVFTSLYLIENNKRKKLSREKDYNTINTLNYLINRADSFVKVHDLTIIPSEIGYTRLSTKEINLTEWYYLNRELWIQSSNASLVDFSYFYQVIDKLYEEIDLEDDEGTEELLFLLRRIHGDIRELGELYIQYYNEYFTKTTFTKMASGKDKKFQNPEK